MTIPQDVATIILTLCALNMVRAAWNAETPGELNAALAGGLGCVVWVLLLWWGGFWS